ncbi:MAG: hypothetical protein Q8P86_02920 [bacterium]|nr:hypothetical protein [bacterium]
MPDLFLIASTMKVVGDVMIALVVFSVHMHIMKEKSIDANVVRYMKRERMYVVIGITLIVGGYVLEIMARTAGV